MSDSEIEVRRVPMTMPMLKGLKVIELNWHQHGKFIPPADFDLDEALDNESFIRALVNRGITLPKTTVEIQLQKDLGIEGHTTLSEQQTAAVLTVVNFNDKRTRNAKLKDLGISVSTWNGWLKDPKFNEYYMGLANKQFAQALPTAQESLIRAMEGGKVEAIKFYMDLMGKGPGSNEGTAQNVRIILQKLVEVLQLHIHDTEVLGAIGLDFDRVLKGENPVGPQDALARSLV